MVHKQVLLVLQCSFEAALLQAGEFRTSAELPQGKLLSRMKPNL